MFVHVFCIHNSSGSVDVCSKSATFGGDVCCAWARAQLPTLTTSILIRREEREMKQLRAKDGSGKCVR